MPVIGNRILKSALAVYLCFCIYVLRGESGIPFYSAIAAIICMQPNVSNSLTTAINRVIGTFIGAFWGMIFLTLLRRYFTDQRPFLFYGFVSLGIIVVIYSTVLLKQTAASYISTVVYLCITISHFDDISPFTFAFNRTLDTLIGIFVALAINYIPYLFKKGKGTLYTINLNDLQPHECKELLSPDEKVKFNLLLERNAKILFTTSLPHSSIMPSISSLTLELPMICLGGAGIYDKDQSSYINSKPMKRETTREVLDVFYDLGINCFTSTLYHDFLHVYYETLDHPIEQEIIASVAPKYQRHYICDKPSNKTKALQILCVQSKENISLLMERLETLPCYEELSLHVELVHEYENDYYLTIMTKDTTIESAIEEIMEKEGIDSILRIPFLDGGSTIKVIEQHFYHKFWQRKT